MLLSKVAEVIERSRAYIAAEWPGWEPLACGHAGDGSTHSNVMPTAGMVSGDARRNDRAMLDGLYVIMRALGGSFSTEHGIGCSRRDVHWDWLTADEKAATKASCIRMRSFLNRPCQTP